MRTQALHSNWGGVQKGDKHPSATRQALPCEVVYDLDDIIARFEAGPLRSFASFKSLAAELRICDIFNTHHVGCRTPPMGEPIGAYATLIFEMLVRRLADAQRTFAARLGAMYLLLCLHELQPCKPKWPIPILQSQWDGIERLARELRDLRHADGFRALHTLWTGDRFVHSFGSHNVLNAWDIRFDDEAEREAVLLPARNGVAQLGSCPYALQAERALPSLQLLESRYEEALRTAALATTGNDAPSPLGDLLSARPTVQLASQIGAELRQYEQGTWTGGLMADSLTERPADLLHTVVGTDGRRGAASLEQPQNVLGVAPALLEGEGAIDDSYRRREGVRHRPFAPRRRRARDGMGINLPRGV
jgi:hypothetical protein